VLLWDGLAAKPDSVGLGIPIVSVVGLNSFLTHVLVQTPCFDGYTQHDVVSTHKNQHALCAGAHSLPTQTSTETAKHSSHNPAAA
jgi:hypothetical protein